MLWVIDSGNIDRIEWENGTVYKLADLVSSVGVMLSLSLRSVSALGGSHGAQYYVA
jgi:hypothetical protein